MDEKKIVFFILIFYLIANYIYIYIYIVCYEKYMVIDKQVSIYSYVDSNNISDVEELVNYYNNQDIKGIVSIEGEDEFRYPVVQYKDNEFYLSHDYYKEYNKKGSIYADYRVDLDSSRKILLYGHSASTSVTPFGNLEKYYDKDYYNNHKYVDIITNDGYYKYEIFSVYVETEDFTYMNINFSSENAWYKHILKLQSKSMYDIDIDLNKEDNILIMQTCSNNSKYKNYDKKYLLVIARRISE